MRSLHGHLLRAPRQGPATIPGSFRTEPACPVPIPIHKHTWKNITPAIHQRIQDIQRRWHTFGPLDNQILDIPRLRLDALRAGRAPPNAAAHLTALLALYFVEGGDSLRPAWENVSLSSFARGRIEWVQTVSEATSDFVLEAAAATATDLEGGGEGGGDALHRRHRLRTLFDRAAASYARALVDAGRGHGEEYVDRGWL